MSVNKYHNYASPKLYNEYTGNLAYNILMTGRNIKMYNYLFINIDHLQRLQFVIAQY